MKAFVKKEAVLCIALLCAVLSMFLVPPDGGYAGYVDYRVLVLPHAGGGRAPGLRPL